MSSPNFSPRLDFSSDEEFRRWNVFLVKSRFASVASNFPAGSVEILFRYGFISSIDVSLNENLSTHCFNWSTALSTCDLRDDKTPCVSFVVPESPSIKPVNEGFNFVGVNGS